MLMNIVKSVALTAGILCGMVFIVGLIVSPPTKPKETKTDMVRIEMPIKPIETSLTVYPKKTVTNIKVSPDQVVYFDTEVNQVSVDVAIGMLTEMSERYNDVYVLINSPGGSVFDGLRLIAFIESSNTRIHTVCVYLCASMAAHLHQSGKTRLIEDSGILMFHPASGQVRGQVENMVSQLNFIQELVNTLDAKASAKSNIPYEEFKRRVAYELWAGPQDALNKKLADKLVYVRTGSAEYPRGKSIFKEVLKLDPTMRFRQNEQNKAIILEN